MKRLAAVAALALFGCAPDGDGRVVLRVASWGSAADDSAYAQLQQSIYREFERRNPGVEVRLENVPDSYNQKIILNHIANAAPDVMMLDASYAALQIDNGIVEDLRPYLERSKALRLADFFPNVVSVARRGNAIYAIPQDFTPMVVFYNKDLFDQAGVQYPSGAWNFAEFERVARALTVSGAPGEPPRQYGFAFSNWMAGWVMWLWNNGGDVVSPDGRRASGYFDTLQNARTIAFLASLMRRGYSPTISQTAATGVDPFANGQAAMAVSGHWSIVGYKEAPKDARTGKPKLNWRRIGVAAMPHNVATSQTVMYEAGYAIPRRARRKALAWKFIEYMMSLEVQRKYQSSGIAISARKDLAQERARDPLEAQFLPIVPSARPPYGTRIENYDFVEKQGQNAMNSVLQSGIDPLVALRRAARRIDQEFAKR